MQKLRNQDAIFESSMVYSYSKIDFSLSCPGSHWYQSAWEMCYRKRAVISMSLKISLSHLWWTKESNTCVGKEKYISFYFGTLNNYLASLQKHYRISSEQCDCGNMFDLFETLFLPSSTNRILLSQRKPSQCGRSGANPLPVPKAIVWPGQNTYASNEIINEG